MTLLARAVAVAIVGASVAPAPTGYVVGFVQDTACAPVPGARVSVDGRTNGDVVTDAQGRFVLAVENGGPTTSVTARLTGFRSFTRTGIRLGAGARDSHTLTLDPSALSIADPIVSTGAQPPPTLPQDNRLRGDVLNVSCMPIDNALISVALRAAETVVRTDRAGHFVFGKLPRGSYDLKVRAQGYIPLLRKGTIVSSETSRVRILLERGGAGESDVISAK